MGRIAALGTGEKPVHNFVRGTVAAYREKTTVATLVVLPRQMGGVAGTGCFHHFQCQPACAQPGTQAPPEQMLAGAPTHSESVLQ